jgi:hypothetical protein
MARAAEASGADQGDNRTEPKAAAQKRAASSIFNLLSPLKSLKIFAHHQTK